MKAIKNVWENATAAVGGSLKRSGRATVILGAVAAAVFVWETPARGDWGFPAQFLNATINGSSMTISVANFPPGQACVTFNGVVQPGVVYNRSQQTITIPNIAPSVPPPGTYRLMIGKNDDWPLFADITVGAAGAPGPAGPQGATGPVGPVGPPGPLNTLAVTPMTNMVWIREGSFAMGSPAFEVDRNGNEGPQVSVTIRRGFWMGSYEVSQGLYQSVMGANPSHFTGNPNLPVEQVTWENAVAFCAALTAQEQSNGHIPAGINWAYRLPTEAEWEYAARAGTSTRFSYGDDPGYANLGNYAWCIANSGNTTHPVGGLAPNAWGLYDMYGNVWEWCQDWYAAYPGGSALDPKGPVTGGDYVVRGGSWLDGGLFCRAAERLNSAPLTYSDAVGFRVVLAPTQ